MRAGRKGPLNLAGSLLLAHPSLAEPNFRRTVILLSSHGEDGAMGVVLNRPLDKSLGALTPEFAAGPLADVPLFGGGPVQPEQLILTAWRFGPEGNGFKFFFGFDPGKARELQAEEGMRLRGFLGYAGWTKGQLENELRHNTWVVAPIGAEWLEPVADAGLWRAVLGSLGSEWKLLAGEPEEPGRN